MGALTWCWAFVYISPGINWQYEEYFLNQEQQSPTDRKSMQSLSFPSALNTHFSSLFWSTLEGRLLFLERNNSPQNSFFKRRKGSSSADGSTGCWVHCWGSLYLYHTSPREGQEWSNRDASGQCRLVHQGPAILSYRRQQNLKEDALCIIN